MDRVALFDKDSIDQINWPQTPETLQAKAIPLAMLKEGVERYISNVQTRLFLLKIDDVILPITVNEKEYENSYLTSNYFAIRKMQERAPKTMQFFIKGAGLLLKGIEVNRAVIVNNWLLSGTIYPQITEEQLQLLTQFLQRRFPNHLLMFRGLNFRENTHLIERLQKLSYHKFYARKVFYYDPGAPKSKKTRYHQRRDLRLMEKAGYQVVQTDDWERLIELYNFVYKDKHTKYCPRYSAHFLQKAVSSGFLTVKAIEHQGKIEGVFGFFLRDQTMIVPFLGYDIYSERKMDLYRILTMLIIMEAEKRELLLNDGSGGERAKSFRGMQPVEEYSLIYAKHLKWTRSTFWKIAEKCSTLFS